MRACDKPTRREFMLDALAILGGGTGIGATLATLGGLGGSANAHAANLSGYRALVCVYLSGGNDSFNLILPTDAAGYATYATARQTLAVAQTAALPITPLHSDGHTYGLHPSVPELQTLFAAGHLAIQANVGTLLAPTTRAMVRAGTGLPPQLYSHGDQSLQWMTGRPESRLPLGWGGQVADLLQAANASNGLSMNISISGNNVYQTGTSTLPYSVDAYGGVIAFNGLQSYQPNQQVSGFQDLLTQSSADTNLIVQAGGADMAQAQHLYGLMNSAIGTAATLTTTFPNTDVGRQLQWVAKLISARSALGAGRQIFFVQMGGFDTHNNQLQSQPQLFAALSQALSAFYNATVELGVASNVTSFTMSEFGRTLTSNNGGTDHGWGSHHLVIGGAVNGGDIYGAMPDLTLGGTDDADGNGRIIPTTSTYQYAGALGTWLGAASSDVATLFPNLAHFTAGTPALLTA